MGETEKRGSIDKTNWGREKNLSKQVVHSGAKERKKRADVIDGLGMLRELILLLLHRFGPSERDLRGRGLERKNQEL